MKKTILSVLILFVCCSSLSVFAAVEDTDAPTSKEETNNESRETFRNKKNRYSIFGSLKRGCKPADKWICVLDI